MAQSLERIREPRLGDFWRFCELDSIPDTYDEKDLRMGLAIVRACEGMRDYERRKYAGAHEEVRRGLERLDAETQDNTIQRLIDLTRSIEVSEPDFIGFWGYDRCSAEDILSDLSRNSDMTKSKFAVMKLQQLDREALIELIVDLAQEDLLPRAVVRALQLDPYADSDEEND